MIVTQCCIVGSGPAGALLGYLFARAGVHVVVLEKHDDFLRDFRGDTIHPSTLEILDELGLARELLAMPHSEVRRVEVRATGGESVALRLDRLKTKFPFVAFLPQWDFLEMLTREAARFPSHRLLRNAHATDLVLRGDRVAGVRVQTDDGEETIEADLVVGADGRDSVTRAAARLPRVETSPPMDVFWFRLSRRPEDSNEVALHVGEGRLAVFLDRREYWQVAYVIPKGAAERVKQEGIEALRRGVARVAPEFADRTGEIKTWDDAKLLTVRADRLKCWHRAGYLAIGDAAHAMSPIGGVGINVAIQDAVAAANLLTDPLLRGHLIELDLAEVQRAREASVRLVQMFQSLLQAALVKPALEGKASKIPFLFRALLSAPLLRDLPPRLFALGVKRQHVETKKAA